MADAATRDDFERALRRMTNAADPQARVLWYDLPDPPKPGTMGDALTKDLPTGRKHGTP